MVALVGGASVRVGPPRVGGASCIGWGILEWQGPLVGWASCMDGVWLNVVGGASCIGVGPPRVGWASGIVGGASDVGVGAL